MGELDAHYHPTRARDALDRFVRVSQSRKWNVQWEIEMYEKSVLAFGNRERFDVNAFGSIYGALRSYWQVFRPKSEGCWTAEKVFEVLTSECSAAALCNEVCLFTAEPKLVRHCAVALKGIKPSQEFPTMAVSKFLHFFNPMLFPIYDRAVIGGQVLVRFRNDYDTFCSQESLDRNADGARFLSNYYQWAASIMRPHRDEVMRVFRSWAEDHLTRAGPPIIDKLYARAFEAIAIGAAS